MSKWSVFIEKVKERKSLSISVTIVVLFLIWMTFFDSNSFLARYRTEREIDRVQREIDNYLQDIERTSALIQALDSNSVTIEQFAREEYNMKAPDEDVYIIKED